VAEDSVLLDETLRYWLNGTRPLEGTYCVTSQTIGVFSTLLPLQGFFVLLFLTPYVVALHNKVDTILQWKQPSCVLVFLDTNPYLQQGE
jgi:hypothetical protein